MRILIVSGFLGAGKTTFIKTLLKRSGKTPVVLENEYGQNNLDSRELENAGSSDLKILEFMEGCVCCTKKDAFANTILAISAGLDPPYLVVEPTGVGRLSNILGALRKIRYEKIRVCRPVVVLAPRSFERNLAEFGEICCDQIRHAGRIVFSKVENENVGIVAHVAERVRAINPDAEIVSGHYSLKDAAWWEGLFGESVAPTPAQAAPASVADAISQVSVNRARFRNPGELVVLLEDVLHGEFGRITRAKGVVQAGAEWLRFDLADGLYAIVCEQSADPGTQCVFIGRDIDGDGIRRRLDARIAAPGFFTAAC